MNWQQLLELADMLTGQPLQEQTQDTYLRKAVSAAYYAMFHALANSNADTLVGSSPSVRSSQEWTRTQRALNHGTAKNQMSKSTEMNAFDADIRGFADTFLALQPWRHEADYNPNPDRPFRLSETIQHVQRARAAIEAFQTVSAPERRRFATYILFGQRR